MKNGRLVLDEPTELHEGTEVELLAVDEVDELDPDVPGTGTPAATLLAELRNR